MNKKLFVLVSAACLAAFPVTCQAGDKKKGTDYSYLEDMSIKELRALDAEIHKILGDGGDVKTEEPVEEEEEIEPVLKTDEEFFSDILASYSARCKVPEVSESEWNMMTYEEIVDHYSTCVEAEREFADKYKNAIFDDLNIQYLCKQYVDGVFKQLNACETYNQSKKSLEDYTFFDQNWHSGYSNRCYVIVELADYFDVPFPADGVAVMRTQVEALDSLNAAETRNAQVPHETVKEVQTLLHQIGFKCWNIDGVAGKKTVKAIKRFQEMYGFDVDGIIDDELIEQLKQIKAEKGPEVESNVESTESGT